jgi:ATP-dependent protease ClpP protease subunit
MTDLRAREYSQEERERLAKKGHALPDGSYPIVDREDLENAIQAIGRAKDPDKAKRHIKKRARELGLEELIPEGWNGVDREAMRARLKRPLARFQNDRADWYRIQNKADQKPEIYIFDEIGYFGHTAKGFSDDLNELDVDELTVHINSPGGDIFDGLAIYQALKNHKAKVTVRVDGLAASIASVIAMAADTLIMAPKSTMMIHDGWSITCGNSADMRKTADLLDKQSDIIASVYADRSGQPTDFWRDRMRDETWYNAQEALDAGLIDEIEGQEKKKLDEAFDLSVFAHAGRDKAPEPVVKPVVAKAPEKEDETVIPPVESKEPEPFTWDFADFKSSLKEGIRG